MAFVQRGEFNGHPTLSFKRNKDDEKFWFGFGVSKAEAILENIEELKKFVAEHGETPVKEKKAK